MLTEPSHLIEIPLSIDLGELQIEYTSPETGKSRRRITPRGLRFLKDGDLALVAHCHLRDDERCFGLRRMARVFPAGNPDRCIENLSRLLHPDARRLAVKRAVITGQDRPLPLPGNMQSHARAFLSSERDRIAAISDSATRIGALLFTHQPAASDCVHVLTAQEVEGDLRMAVDHSRWADEIQSEISSHARLQIAKHKIDMEKELSALHAASQAMAKASGSSLHMGLTQRRAGNMRISLCLRNTWHDATTAADSA